MFSEQTRIIAQRDATGFYMKASSVKDLTSTEPLSPEKIFTSFFKHTGQKQVVSCPLDSDNNQGSHAVLKVLKKY